MYIIMNMSNYEIESNSAKEKNADAMFSADWSPVDVHLCPVERCSQANKPTFLPADLAVANPDLFLQSMYIRMKITAQT